MPPIPARPLAVNVPPSEHPFSFVEVINFRADFPPTDGFSNPKGLAYHHQLNRLLVSLSPSGFEGGRKQILNLIAQDGSRSRFSPGYQSYREVESKIAIVPEFGPPVGAGFTPGDIFIGRGPNTEISRLAANGNVLADLFTRLSANSSLWGGLAFDVEGEFGGKLIAVESNGKIFLVSDNGSSELLLDLELRLEGVAIAPTSFGPLARQIIVGCEGYGDDDPHGGKVFAINKNRQISLLANIGFAAEDLQFVPPLGGTFYQTQLCFDRERENRLFSVSASQFMNRLGRLIVNNEMTGELWEVAWNGAQFTQQNVGRVPGRWSSQGFNWQGTELEAACFAIKRPRIPNWSNWSPVPGEFATDRTPAAATDPFGEVLLLSSGLNDREIYMNRFRETGQSALVGSPDSNDGREREWDGWRRDPFRIVTPHALSCAQHNQRMYAFAVNSNGGILHKYFSTEETAVPVQSWADIPGGFLTSTNVSSAMVNGRLVVCALSQDRKIYLNELAPGGRYWSGWYQIPGGGNTDVTPALVSFQDELHVFIKGLASKRILMKARTLNGDWTAWGEVPGEGRTDASITAVAHEGQLFIFVRGTNNLAYANIASETGTWSGWLQLPATLTTDAPLAAAPTGNQVYLFAKAATASQIFMLSMG